MGATHSVVARFLSDLNRHDYQAMCGLMSPQLSGWIARSLEPIGDEPCPQVLRVEVSQAVGASDTGSPAVFRRLTVVAIDRPVRVGDFVGIQVTATFSYTPGNTGNTATVSGRHSFIIWLDGSGRHWRVAKMDGLLLLLTGTPPEVYDAAQPARPSDVDHAEVYSTPRFPCSGPRRTVTQTPAQTDAAIEPPPPAWLEIRRVTIYSSPDAPCLAIEFAQAPRPDTHIAVFLDSAAASGQELDLQIAVGNVWEASGLAGSNRPGTGWGISGSTLTLRPTATTNQSSNIWATPRYVTICATSTQHREPYLPKTRFAFDSLPASKHDTCDEW